MRGCPALYDHGQQHLKARLPVDRVRHVRRHDAVAQTIQSVVHGSDPPVMQDEPQMGVQNIGFYYITSCRRCKFLYIAIANAAGAPRAGRAGCMVHACGFILLCAAANRRAGR